MESLNRLTDACTAFATFAEFVESMKGGYTPTIHQNTRRKRILTRVVRAAGFRVFDGRRTA